ncbi:universal stress protein [Rhizobium sp. TH2]|uniref:universal stress protein n=1 Tax=Rhizobium sp. TH2 TaxID=2775403 RepID=UPI0021584F89|nr:universal stress protein [Rhizobium sp. TH2]UVC10258.1 universal stress protein [Rhizobium sp. TH2]
MYRKIIVPVEMGQLEKGEKILAKAATLLDAGGEIVLMNVVESVPPYITIELPMDFINQSVTEAETKLAALNAGHGGSARVKVVIGSPAREILHLGEEEHADLIIIGSHRPGLANYLLGSTADRVVRHATCSVLVDR